MRSSRLLLSITLAAALVGSGCKSDPKKAAESAVVVNTITMPAIADVPREDPWTFALPDGLTPDQVEGVAVLQGTKYVAADASPKDGRLVITPVTPYERNASYTLRLFAGAGKRYEAAFTTQAHVGIKPGRITEVPASPGQGFHFDYFLYVPTDVKAGGTYRMLVAPNDSNGNISDRVEYHASLAKRVLQPSDTVRTVADQLKLPVLVPTFPYPTRPEALYLQTLSRRSLTVKETPFVRVDLQLVAMLADVRQMLAGAGIQTEAKSFLLGTSAAGQFADRFALLHPDLIQAVAFGSTAGLMTLPVTKYQGRALPYPLGVADLKELTGSELQLAAYKQVPRLVFMGANDTKDWTRDSHAYAQAESDLAHQVFGMRMMPDRWASTQAVARELGLPVQFITYPDGGQKSVNLADLTQFFTSHSGEGSVK